MAGKMGILGIALLLIFVGGLSQRGWLRAADSPSVPTLESLQQDRNTNILDPRSPPAKTTMELFYLILGIVAVIFLLVFIPLCLMLVRFRARKQDAGVEPPQIYGSNPIELAWTVGPAIIVFVLFLVTARSIFEIEAAPPPPDAIHIRVVGHQWWWEFDYVDYGFVTANEMHVPLTADGTPRPIYLDLESADVIHSFWVPQLAGKTDLLPGRVNHMWFEPEEAGWYLGQCAEYCGTQHAHMWLRVKAESEKDFKQWVSEQQQVSTVDPAVAAGRDLFLANACANCHTIRGTHAEGTFAPDLTHLMSRTTIASGIVPNNETYLKQWVHDPNTIKEGCYMPDMKLNPGEVDKIVAYLLSLK